MLAQPAEATEHVGHVRPEDAAQRVQLVDDDVLQAHEERRPPRVRREDAHVQHLGVGEHHVGVLARPRPVVARGVAVVGDGPEPRHEPRAQRAQLVLGERFGGEEQQRGVAPVFDDRRHDRRLVAQRLSRRGSGRDDDAAPGAQRVDRQGLVLVQLVDAARLDALCDLGRQRRRRVGGNGPAVRAVLRGGRNGRSAPDRRRDRRARSVASHGGLRTDGIDPRVPTPCATGATARATSISAGSRTMPSSRKSAKRPGAPAPRPRHWPPVYGIVMFWIWSGLSENANRPSRYRSLMPMPSSCAWRPSSASSLNSPGAFCIFARS